MKRERIDSEPSAPRGRKGSLIEWAFLRGASAFFLGEEALRGVLGRLDVPQDLKRYLLEQGSKGKGELLSMIQKELHGVLERLDLPKELERILSKFDVQVKAEISFSPKRRRE